MRNEGYNILFYYHKVGQSIDGLCSSFGITKDELHKVCPYVPYMGLYDYYTKKPYYSIEIVRRIIRAVLNKNLFELSLIYGKRKDDVYFKLLQVI
jgi:hypothetical protein